MLASLEGPVETYIARVADPAQAVYRFNKTTQHPYTKVVTYHNTTKYDIVVVDRSGVAITVDRQKAIYDKVFVTVVTWEIPAHKLPQFTDDLIRANRFQNSETDMYIYKASNNNSRPSAMASVEVHYVVDEYKLTTAKDHTLYIENIDTVLSLATVDQVPRHPHSQSSLLPAKELYITKDLEVGDSFYSVEIIDNTSSFGDRFINNNGIVQRIRARKDITRHEGVYLRYCDENKTGASSCYIQQKYFEFDAADKALSLFRSRSDATILGDMAHRQKMDLATAQEKAHKAKLDIEEHDRVREVEKNAYTYRKDIRDMKSAEVRHSQELMMFRVKSVQDVLKSLGVIGGAALTLYTLMLKFHQVKA